MSDTHGAEPLILDALRKYGTAYLDDDPDELGIKAKKYEAEGLLVLNYCQVSSPKTNPVTQQCRGLIVSWPGCEVVSRSFDRFFNYGEAENEGFDIQPGDVVVDKVDGSLIKLYHWEGRWRVSTRGTAFAEAEIGTTELRFADLFFLAVPNLDWGLLDKDCTYMFELTTPENRVVRDHKDRAVTYLATRHNRTAEYLDHWHLVEPMGARKLGSYTFDTAGACVEAAGALPDLEEGYVVYRGGRPVCKIKSPAYVAAHRLFSGPMTLKRLVEMTLLGEVPEFIAYFPEFGHLLNNAAHALNLWMLELDATYAREWGPDEGLNQKEFAMLVKDRDDSALLFRARMLGVSPSKAWGSCKDGFRQQTALRVLDGFGGLT